MREAASIGAALCTNPKCLCIHIIMRDERDEIISSAALADEDARALIKDVEAALYHKAVMKDVEP